MQQPAQTGWLAVGLEPAVGIDPGIEQKPLADGPVGQFGGQSAIEGRQVGFRQFPFQGVVRKSPRSYRLQHLPGQASGSETVGFRRDGILGGFHGCCSLWLSLRQR